jgi:hypothetical protein
MFFCLILNITFLVIAEYEKEELSGKIHLIELFVLFIINPSLIISLHPSSTYLKDYRSAFFVGYVVNFQLDNLNSQKNFE